LTQRFDALFIPVVVSLVAAHSISRFMAVVSIQFYPYVTPDDTSKAKPSAAKKLSGSSFFVALLFAVVFFAFLPFTFLLVVPLLVLATVLLNRYFARWIGGHTGDCLGSVQQVTEVLCYLTMLLLWKFI
jgi:adenosylcobinamide-GDP ribazoletransferase